MAELETESGKVPTIVSANPLKAAGAAPPVRAFTFDHCAPHHVNDVDAPADATLPSPSSNAPRDGIENTIAVFEVSDDGR